MFKSWLDDYAVKNRFLDAGVIIRFLWCDWLEKLLKIIKNANISLVMYNIAEAVEGLVNFIDVLSELLKNKNKKNQD